MNNPQVFSVNGGKGMVWQAEEAGADGTVIITRIESRPGGKLTRYRFYQGSAKGMPLSGAKRQAHSRALADAIDKASRA